MNKKIKMFRFEATDLMNKFLVLPTMDMKTAEEIDITPIKEFIKQNEKDLAELNKYFEDMTSAYKAEQTILNPPKNIETRINTLVLELEKVINQYYQEKAVKKLYTGKTAYYISDGTADFLDNGKDYFGHCIAFGKYITWFICDVIIKYSLNFAQILIYLWFKIHLPKLADPINCIVEFIYDEINKNLDKYEGNPTGMMCFYFDRVDKISKIHDYFDPKLQPGTPWEPSDYYNQANWIKVFP